MRRREQRRVELHSTGRAGTPVPTRALLLVNIGQLVSLRSEKSGPRRGRELADLGIIEDGAVLCLGGKIVSVGRTKDALRDPWFKKNRKKIVEIDCEGQVVLPGFVDSHTHPVFVAPRLVDFEKRISGATYEQIAEAGGGIRSSIDGVRGASKIFWRQVCLRHCARWRIGARPPLRPSQDTGCRSKRRSSRWKRFVRRRSGRERWWQRCWERMWFPRNFRDAPTNTFACLRADDPAGGEAEAGCVRGCVYRTGSLFPRADGNDF